MHRDFDVMENQSTAERIQSGVYQCSHCVLKFKSKIFLFKHLDSAHGFGVEDALGADAHDEGSASEPQRCDFKACSGIAIEGANDGCENAEKSKGGQTTSDDPEAVLWNPLAGDAGPASKAKRSLSPSKGPKANKKPLQAAGKNFLGSPGSHETPPEMLTQSPMRGESTGGTLLLTESPSNPNSSGVFKVTAKSLIDFSKEPHQILQNDQVFIADPTQSPKEQVQEPPLTSKHSKRTCGDTYQRHAARKIQNNEEDAKLAEESSFCRDLTLRDARDQDHARGGETAAAANTRGQNTYFCKHCDYRNECIEKVSSHYHNNHPYIRFNSEYIKDPNAKSATFRCLVCPVEYLSVATLKAHHRDNHKGAPDVFQLQLCELSLVFKCFLCPLTTHMLESLEEHYREKHPAHQLDNALMRHKYLETTCQEESSQSSPSEKTPCSDGSGTLYPEMGSRMCEEVKCAPSFQSPTSRTPDAPAYKCANCDFGHKSPVVLHLHYRNHHPEKVVTIDKIKKSLGGTSRQIVPEKNSEFFISGTIIEKPTPSKGTSDSAADVNSAAQTSPQNCSLFELNTKHFHGFPRSSPESARTQEIESAEDGLRGIDALAEPVVDASTFSGIAARGVVSLRGEGHSEHTRGDGEDAVNHGVQEDDDDKHGREAISAAGTSSEGKSGKQDGAHDDEALRHKESDKSPKSSPEVNAYVCPEDLYYCQNCNYGNPSIKGVLNHQIKVHKKIPINSEHVTEYTDLIRDKIRKVKSQTKESASAISLPLPIINEGDEEMFFCHLCNFRKRTFAQILHHYSRSHRGFHCQAEQVRLYTAVVYEQTRKLHLTSASGQEVHRAPVGKKESETKKIKNLGQSATLPVPSSMRASQMRKALYCYKCTYSTEHEYLLRRHVRKTHRANRPDTDAPRVASEQGRSQSSYQCDLCSFCHKNAAGMSKHYQTQHPENRPSREFIINQLYVGQETLSSKKKMRKVKEIEVDSPLSLQKPGQNETKTYSCRACSFKGSSVESVTLHYRAIHPWSVKEDGSVPDVVRRRKASANIHSENESETSGSFETYQAPGDSENFTELSCESPPKMKRSCPSARAQNQGGGGGADVEMEPQKCAPESLVTEQEQEAKEEQMLPVEIFRCPQCMYVNDSYQGVVIHCQNMHPELTSSGDALNVEKTQWYRWDKRSIKDGPDDAFKCRGYMCKLCEQIHSTLKRLNKHLVKVHDESVPGRPQQESNPAKQKSKAQKYLGSKLQHASYRKKYARILGQHYTYSRSSKIAMGQHLHLKHKNPSAPEVRNCVHTCVLCAKSYLRKKNLGCHYATKHGQDAFLKYFAEACVQSPEEAAPASPQNPPAGLPEDKPESCDPGAEPSRRETKKVMFKCPRCPYVNASLHGMLTHCQMRHPSFRARADTLQKDEIQLGNMVNCTMGKASNERGYVCKFCPQIHASLSKLRMHCAADHSQAEHLASEHPVESETENLPLAPLATPPSAAASSPNRDSSGGVDGGPAPRSDAQQMNAAGGRPDEVFCKCSLCSFSSLKSRHLGNHYSKKHGKSVLLKGFAGAPREKTSSDPGRSQAPPGEDEEPSYRCHICKYTAHHRKYLASHYKHKHKFSSLTTHTLLSKYNKKKVNYQPRPEDADRKKCQNCPDLDFDSSQQLLVHYSEYHGSDVKPDFTVLTPSSEGSPGVYACAHCQTQVNGIEKLCVHLDRHGRIQKRTVDTGRNKPSIAFLKITDARSDTTGELEAPPASEETSPILSASHVSSSSPPPPMAGELPEVESRGDRYTCAQCAQPFRSLTGLRSHERSHTALAAVNKINLPTSLKKHSLNKYFLYKSGTSKPFRCLICSYQTSVFGMWRGHFVKKHRDVMVNSSGTDEHADGTTPPAGLDGPTPSGGKPGFARELLYLEPPLVQQQLNQISLMAQRGASPVAMVQETAFPDNGVLHCEFCQFSSSHQSSIRRHYLQRHGKKVLRCKECNFFSGLRKTLAMHMETAHSLHRADALQNKDHRCPFCLYQTKDKNNMIDHVVLHREERVVPIEVRRPKLSHYLRGIVFRCHKCTFTSASNETLRLHMTKHDDIKPYKCCLCFFDCGQLGDLEAHLCDKHQVVRNHDLVGQVSLDKLQARRAGMPEEEEEEEEEGRSSSSLRRPNSDREDARFVPGCVETSRESQGDDAAANAGMATDAPPAEPQHQKPEGGDVPSFTPLSESQTLKEEQKETSDSEKDADPKLQTQDGDVPEKNGGRKDLRQQKAAEQSSGERARERRPQMEALQNTTLNIEALVEDDILRRILQLDDDRYVHRGHRRATEHLKQSVKSEFSDVRGDTSGGDVPPNAVDQPEVKTESGPSERKKNHKLQNNGWPQQSSTPEAPRSTKSKERPGVSTVKCKEHAHSPENQDGYGEMPVLEKEEIHGGDENPEDQDLERRDVPGLKQAHNRRAPQDPAAASDGADEEKPFACELCGRKLSSVRELERHILRHGM